MTSNFRVGRDSKRWVKVFLKRSIFVHVSCGNFLRGGKLFVKKDKFNMSENGLKIGH